MISFKEHIITEKVEIMQVGGSSLRGMLFPVSTARNVTAAKIELVKTIESAEDGKYNINHENAVEELSRIRGIYNIENGKISVWYAIDALHNNVIARKGLRDKAIHLNIHKGKLIALDGPLRSDFTPKEAEKWFSDVERWGGKVAKSNRKDFHLD